MSARVYPQLTSGALSQFPLKKRLQQRTVINNLADGSSVKLSDVTGGSTGWQLQYAGLTDAEMGSLQQFFESCEGSLNGFTFVDPAGNLLAWSEDLTNSVWQAGPLLSVTGGVGDPLGGKQGFNLANSGASAQGISQTLNAPGGYVYTLSVYAQASASASVTLSIGNQGKSFAIGSSWTRVSFTASGDPTASSIAFAIQCAPGGIAIFGPQVEAQPAASAYKRSSTGGVYQNARFQDDVLPCTSTAPNQNSVTVNIFYANHL
ncbi:MAG: hypothetical protein WBY44_25500 [Bryobacteraceae bacterium]|jgi:hypothetical protein